MAAAILLIQAGASAQPPPAAPSVSPISAGELRQALADRRGHAILVNFWATWCHACLKEIPALTELTHRYEQRGLEFVPIALDDPGDRDSLVVPFLRKWFPEFRTWLRTDSSMDMIVSVLDPAWNEILPTSYIVDRDGKVVARLQGGKSIAELETALRPHM